MSLVVVHPGSLSRPAKYSALMATLVLTLIGTDRAGLVSAVSRLVDARGGSWERSQLAHLGGVFAGVVEVHVPAAEADGLVADVEALAADGLRVTVERSAGATPPESTRRMRLGLVGADHPGIVAEVSALLTRHGVNVEELSTRVVAAPMAGGTLFEAEGVVGVPDDADVAGLRAALEELAHSLMVDTELAELD
jgi:glycine cleavage system regulatory protein